MQEATANCELILKCDHLSITLVALHVDYVLWFSIRDATHICSTYGCSMFIVALSFSVTTSHFFRFVVPGSKYPEMAN